MSNLLSELPLPAQPLQGRRFKLGSAYIALLLILTAAGLGLLTWAANPERPLSGTQGDASAAGDNQLRIQAASPSGSLEEILAHPDVIPTHRHPLVGMQAPDFELADSDGKIWNLRELRDGGPVVLVFYYGYHCIGCVRHLSELKRDLRLFQEIGARVVAISADPPELTRQQFQQSGPFDFPVLSDPENKVARAYQVFKQDNLRHGTFVIDRQGTVQWVNVGDAPFRRNSALLYQLANIEDRLPSIGRRLP